MDIRSARADVANNAGGTLGDALRNEATAPSALRSMWNAGNPRRKLIADALNTGDRASNAAASEFELIASSSASVDELSACAAAAAAKLLENPGHTPARRILLACARAAVTSKQLRTAARIAAVAERVIGAGPDGIFALADAGFVRQAAAAAVRAADTNVEELPQLLHATLVLLPRISDEKLISRVANAALKTANTASADAQIRATLLAVRAVAVDDPSIVHALVSVYESFLGSVPNHAIITRHVSSLDVALVFVLLACSADTILKRRVLALLCSILRAPSESFALIPRPAAAASSSSALVQSIDSCTRVLQAALEIPGIEEWGTFIADTLDSLLRARDSELRTVVEGLIAHLFMHHERARTRVLAYTFDAMSDTAPDAPGPIYARVLAQLANNPNAHVIFRSHVATLTDWLPALTTIDFEAAGALANALAAIASSLPTFSDKLIIHVRKLLGESSTVARLLAISILIAIAEASNTTSQLFEEVANLVQAALRSERDLKVPTLARAVTAIRNANSYTRQVRWVPINSVVLQSVQGNASLLSLNSCFTTCCDSLPARKDIPLLLSYANALRESNQVARRFVRNMDSYLTDPRKALVDACNPPIRLNDTMQSKWVATRSAMLIALCQSMVYTEPKQISSSGSSSSASTRVDDSIDMRLAVVYTLAFMARESVPRALCVKPCHERSCGEAKSSVCVTAREKCANETLSSSKTFELLQHAGAVEGDCSLDAESCNVLLRAIPGVEEIAGKCVGSVLRAEVFSRWALVLKSTELQAGSKEYVRKMAVTAFSDTNPTSERQISNGASIEQTSTLKKQRRKSARCAAGQIDNRGTKKRRRSMLIPEPEIARKMMVPARDRDKNNLPSSCEGESEVSTDSVVRTEFQEVIDEIRYIPAREALQSAFSRRNEVREDSRLALRSASIALLLHSASKGFRSSEWSFLVGSSGVVARASECMRELVALFELDFKRGMSSGLALDYILLLGWFLKNDAQVGPHVVGATARILSEYTISQMRIVQGLLSLLLDALPDEKVLPVVQDIFAWLGEEQGILDPNYNEERATFDGSFAMDIVEEACELDGISTADLGEREYPPVPGDGSTADEDEGVRLLRKKKKTSQSVARASNMEVCLPDGTAVRRLGLNDSDEVCLACVYVALERLKITIPTSEQLKKLNEDAVTKLGSCISAMGALLATQRSGAVKWSIRTLRLVSDVIAKVLGAADFLLHHCREEMKRKESKRSPDCFSRVLAVCAQALRGILAKPAGRAIAAEGRVKKAAAKLELHVPAALADLAATSSGAPGLDDVADAYRELAGIKLTGNDPPSKPRRKRSKSTRLRSRNSAVDDMLQYENGEDNFADLEDFVVGMDDEVV